MSGAAPPPAASTVVAGKTEREIALERELEDARQGRRTAETLAAEKERRVQELEAAAAATPKRKSGIMEKFYDGDPQDAE